MMEIYRAPTATTGDPHVFEKDQRVVIHATDQVGKIVSLQRGAGGLMVCVELEDGVVTEVPADKIAPYSPAEEPDTWVDHDRETPKIRNAGWVEVGVHWLKTFAHQSAWVAEALFTTDHEVGEVARGPLGNVQIVAIGHSPMGTVYRVRPVHGGEEYDLMEDELSTAIADREMALAAADPYQAAYSYVYRAAQGNPGGTFNPDMSPFEPGAGFMSGIRGLGDSEERIVEPQFNPGAIRAYHDKWLDAMKHHDLRLGVWQDGGYMYFDLAVYLPTRPTAIMHCINHVQLAAYDLATNMDVRVLTDDGTAVLPEILEEAGGVDLQAKLDEARVRWGFAAPAPEPPPTPE